MKKVLILTASTGQGHNQAANSLNEAFIKRGFITSKHDFLEGSTKFLISVIVGSYEVSAMKYPGLYGGFYKLTNNKLVNPLSLILFFFVRRRLYNLIKKENPSIIVTTHPLSICLIAGLKRRGIKVPFVSIVTDFKAHYTYISKSVDCYITGSEFTKNSIIKKGIDKDKIFPLGIPINKTFFNRDTDISIIKDKEYFNILLMSGSMGLEDISFVLEELLRNEHKLRITVVCGNNKDLKNNLDHHANIDYPNKKLHIVGFSTDIASFMEYSDVLISKPGGLTVTESIAKNLPLVVPFAIPGQEQENAEFLASSGLAIKVSNISDINTLIDDLIENPTRLSEIKANIKALADTYSIEAIIDLCDKLQK